ncbi:hypothetical protein [Tumebacillus permanentifrigoris]|uniref:Type II secretory pathway pseudopilin PulG n=1 Tax=Tumebacillus permanentifrigoris TaxID=378543 RepID=A0A316D3L8_9BACL|nr:hypothetical protein [Tumebacillus permanentifrigoris]PWK06254.1 hypothetical protein C7459_12017 [Tumebacillus permanentifrigoris]
MRDAWRNERGSALLLVLLVVTVLGMMIGGVTLAVHNSGEESLRHERQVQTEFQMEQAMEIALYMLYNQPDQFEATFRNQSKTPCMVIPPDNPVQVCLETTQGEQGQTAESLVVRAEKPTSAIRYTLPDTIDAVQRP